MKVKTILGIRKNPAPLFVSVASTDGVHALSAFQDTENNALFIAAGDEHGFAYSPISGKKIESLSISEIAAEADDLAGYSSIGKCTSKKCCATMLTTPEISAMLESAGEESIHCTACGSKVELSFDEDSDESEDEDMGDMSDDDGDMSEDEDMDDSSEGDDEEDMGDDESSDDEDEDTTMSEDDDMGDEGDDGVGDDDSSEDEEMVDDDDMEIAALLEEIAADDGVGDDDESSEDDETMSDDSESNDMEELSDTIVAATMHTLSDTRSGKLRVLFLDADTAMLQHTPEGHDVALHIGNFRRDHAASEAVASLFDRREVFGRTVNKLIAEGALAEATPSAEIANFGFQPITVGIPFTVAQAAAVEAEVAKVQEQSREEASTKLADIAGNYSKLVAVAAVGIDKGVISGTSVYRELAGLLHSLGMKNAEVVARNFCDSKMKPFLAAAIEKANELAGKDPNYVSGMTETVSKAAYAPVIAADEETDDHSSTVDTVVASLDYVAAKPKIETNGIRTALRRIGRHR